VIETVILKDHAGNPIEGLTERDFIVTEDGVRQSIAICEFQKLEDAPLPPISPRSTAGWESAPVSQIAGGKAMLDYNDLSRGIVDAQQDVSSYYILGYYTTNTELDGKFRKIKIELADGRQAKLEYRKGYYARKKFSKFTAADKERQLEEALMLGDPITDLTIAMEVNYFKLNSAEYYVPVTMKIPGSELVLAKETGSDRTVMDFIGEIRDDYGSVYANLRDKVSFKLKGETAAALMKRPIEYDCGFTSGFCSGPERKESGILASARNARRIGCEVVIHTHKEIFHIGHPANIQYH